jgi:hypothetical protein
MNGEAKKYLKEREEGRERIRGLEKLKGKMIAG